MRPAVSSLRLAPAASILVFAWALSPPPSDDAALSLDAECAVIPESSGSAGDDLLVPAPWSVEYLQ